MKVSLGYSIKISKINIRMEPSKYLWSQSFTGYIPSTQTGWWSKTWQSCWIRQGFASVHGLRHLAAMHACCAGQSLCDLHPISKGNNNVLYNHIYELNIRHKRNIFKSTHYFYKTSEAL